MLLFIEEILIFINFDNRVDEIYISNASHSKSRFPMFIIKRRRVQHLPLIQTGKYDKIR